MQVHIYLDSFCISTLFSLPCYVFTIVHITEKHGHKTFMDLQTHKQYQHQQNMHTQTQVYCCHYEHAGKRIRRDGWSKRQTN